MMTYNKIDIKQAAQIFEIVNLLDDDNVRCWLMYGEGMAAAAKAYAAKAMLTNIKQ
jgi:hypothetical protein